MSNSSKPNPAPNLQGTLTTLVIDDQPAMRAALKRLLDSEPTLVLQEFSNATDAITFLKNNPVDLIVTDLYMPKGSGFDLISFVRNRPMANDTPIVVVSGEATRDDIVHAIDIGASDYILKPFEPKDFLAKIKTVVMHYQDPTPWEVELRWAESKFLKGEIAEAETIFRKMTAEDGGKSPRVLAGIALCEMSKKELETAERTLLAAIRANNLYFPAYNILGDLYIQKNEREKAKSTLFKELSINGKQPARRLVLARLLAQDDGPEKAAEEIRKGLLANPRDEALLLYAGELMAQEGNEEKAIHYYLRARKSNPECVKALNNIADLCLRVGKPDKAHNIFKDMLKVSSKQTDIVLANARLLEQEKKYDEALSEVDAFLILNTRNIEALKLKAKILAKRERFEDALAIYDQIEQIAPNEDNQSRIALTQLKLKNFESAIQHYKNAITQSPQNASYHFNMAYALELTKNYPEAIKAYEKTISLEPTSTDARIAVDRVRGFMKSTQASQPKSAQPLAAPTPKKP
jgi:tetratricopeptide (TPR) repeat protein